MESRLAQLNSSLSAYPSLLKRTFIATSCDSDTDTEVQNSSSAKLRLRVMQFNALADALSSGSDNFVKCPPEALTWSFRKQRILQELLTYEADVICLQEIDDFQFFEIELQSLGYNGIWFPKPWSPCLDVPGNLGADGCAVFYKCSKLSEVSRHTDILMSSAGTTNQVMIVLCLRDLTSRQCFWIAVTHLKARRQYVQYRLEQGRFLLSRLAQLVPAMAPVIVCGDFNALPEEPVVQAFRDGLPSLFTFESAYVLATGNEMPYTTWKYRGQPSGPPKEERHTIDYIWCSRTTCTVEAVLVAPDDDDVGPDRLPCLAYPSDHLSLVADITLAWQK